jgi:sugar lactone lactonase YvrE
MVQGFLLTRSDGAKGTFMKHFGKIIPFLLAVITGCSSSVSTTPDLLSGDEYSFSDKALSESYLSRKFNSLLNPVNETKILKELKYGQYKNPDLVKEVMRMNPGMLSIITALGSVSAEREINPAFDSFIKYLEQTVDYISTFAGDGYQNQNIPNSGIYNGDNILATKASLNQAYDMAFDSTGNIFIADYYNNRIRRIDKITGIITTIAGNSNQNDSGDNGRAGNAEINTPGMITFDKNGNLYFSEEFGQKVREIIAVNGSITPDSIIATLAGTGDEGFDGDNGPASAALLSHPWGLAFDKDGSLFISDTFNHRVRKLTAVNGTVSPSSVITTIAGTGDAGFNGDNMVGTDTSLYRPWEITFDKDDNLLISDSFNNRIRKLTAVNGLITADSTVTTLAGTGNTGDSGEGGPAIAAELNQTGGMLFDNTGRLIFTDYFNNKVKYIDSQGNIHTLAGTGDQGFGGDNGPASAASFYLPWSLSIDGLGNLYIVDAFNHRIRKLTTVNGTVTPDSTVTTIAGNGAVDPGNSNSGRYNGDNIPASKASLSQPWEMVIDKSGNIFIADYYNNRIRKVDKITRIITTIAGDGIPGSTGDNGPARDAEINTPGAMTFDKAGNLYFSEDFGHHVRKLQAVNGVITPDSTITTIAGDGYYDPNSGNYGRYNGDNVAATQASLNRPWGLAFDKPGNLFIADVNNQRIRKLASVNGVVSASSVITTVAGSNIGGFNSDGIAGKDAFLNLPNDLAFDNSGNLLFSDAANNRIRKLTAVNGEITPDSVITTVAGTGDATDGGDEGPAIEASLSFPAAIAFDKEGNLLIVDFNNNKVKYVDLQGNIHTLAGTGSRDFGGDDGPALEASLNGPWGIGIDAFDNIYIVDTLNQRIRKISR